MSQASVEQSSWPGADWIGRLHRRVAALHPWQAGLAAAGLGVLSVAAQPPFNIWPALIVGLTGLVWLLDGASARPHPVRAMAFRAWAFGFGYFAAGLWWIANAFVARGDGFLWMIPFAVTLTPAGLALFWAAAGAACALYWPKSPRRIAVFAIAVFVVEYLRGHILTGFPWQMAGMAWNAGGPVAQGAAWIGLYGLSLLTLFAFAAPAALAGPVRDGRGWMRFAPAVAGFVALAALFGAGIGRLAAADPALTDVRIRVVQAAVPQGEKYTPENAARILDLYLRLTASPELEHVDMVVWPESALPVLLLDDGATLARLSELLAGRAALATGVIRCISEGGTRCTGAEDEEFRNSLAVLDFAGGAPRLAGLYDKVKLVPFGEFMPGGRLLTSIGFRLPNIVEGGYTSGEDAATLRTGLAPPFAPLICYEIIFPRFTPRGADRPQWMLNVSNDSWFGESAGPLQHFAQARYRAIEEGLPLIRSASGGISGAIDAWGRVRGELSPAEPGILDIALPIAAPPTFYSRFGDLACLLLVLVLAAVASGRAAILPRTTLTKAAD